MFRRPFATAFAALIALGALAGCAETTAELPETKLSSAGLPVVPEEVGHVHGITVNPADDLLYLGTHAGTLVIEGDTITRVGDSTIDLMGFAGAGPDHFYASGHPGPADDMPNPVGLIESTDGGETWRALSLAGDADFHALGAAGERIVGFDGQMLSTSDGEDWTTGAGDVAPASIAVDPGDDGRVVATTEHGPLLSTDAGATFTHLDGAPLLVFLAWPSPDALYGVSPEGTIHVSADGGTTWTERGDAGGPSAFTASADGAVAVVTQTQILSSRDGGTTFEPVAEVAGDGHSH